MHELSLAEDVIKIAESELKKNNALSVCEITIEVGNMSGVEADTFESALHILSGGSCIEKSEIKVIKRKGKGICHKCGVEFEMEHRIDECPRCHSLPSEIRGGKEFRVISLVVETDDIN